ncbi:hypothetical protein D3C78_1699020 [compost metagenome]
MYADEKCSVAAPSRTRRRARCSMRPKLKPKHPLTPTPLATMTPASRKPPVLRASRQTITPQSRANHKNPKNGVPACRQTCHARRSLYGFLRKNRCVTAAVTLCT